MNLKTSCTHRPSSNGSPAGARPKAPNGFKRCLLSGPTAAAACVATLGLLAGCGGGGDEAGSATALGAGGGPRGGQASANMAVTLAGVAATPLSADEAAGLSFMREEEKLARDVYAALYAQWRLTTFDNIAASEQSHMDALLLLLQRYGLPDPAATTAAGVFGNPVLQGLYGALVATGQTSLVAALQVGAEIEELDIHDLRTLKTQVDNADLTLVYENLEQGSRNHLRAFHTNLLRQGASYTPKHITQVEYDAIVLSARETGML